MADVPRTESDFARALAESIRALQHPLRSCSPFDLAIPSSLTDSYEVAESTSSPTVADVSGVCLPVYSWPNTFHATHIQGGFAASSLTPLDMNMLGPGTTSGWFPSAASLPLLDHADILKPFYPEEKDRMLVSACEQTKAGCVL